MKPILKELGVDLNLPSVIVGFGGAAQGKSTLSTYLVKELHDAGKHVSVISDDSEKLWLTRLKNVGCKSSDAKIIYKRLPPINSKELFDFITKQKEAMPFINCLVLDISIVNYDKNWQREIFNFVRSNEMFMFITSQKSKQLDDTFKHLTNVHSSLDKLLLSDVALSIDRKQNPKLSFWKRFLNLFRPLFGLKKYKPMNTEIMVHKNRGGKDGYNFDYQLDFGKINEKNI